MTDEDATHAVVVLVEGDEEAATVAAIIRDLADPAALVVTPPFRGEGFFADIACASDIDRWWAENVPRTAEPVYVLDFSPSLLTWIAGLDGHFIIRRGRDEIPAGTIAGVEVVDASSSLELVGHVLGHLAAAGVCSVEHAGGVLAFAKATRRAPVPSPPQEEPPTASAPIPPPSMAVAAQSPHAPTASRNVPEAPQRAAPRSARATHRRGRPLGELVRRTGLFASRSERLVPPPPDAQLATAITRRKSTIVVVGSRNSAALRTSHAAGIAMVADSALNAAGQRAVIVHCNVPDAGARDDMPLPPDSGTVSDAIAALMANRDPPGPVFAAPGALPFYVESRESSEHSRDEIMRLASHLRTAFAFSVIDLGERLSHSTTDSPTVVAAYWLELADVVVLPTAWAKQDFNRVLDYLETPEHPPAVVAYLAPRARRDREHPVTQRFVAGIALRAQAVVELPEEMPNVRYSGAAGIRLDRISPRLRDAYRSLTHAVVRAAGSGTR